MAFPPFPLDPDDRPRRSASGARPPSRRRTPRWLVVARWGFVALVLLLLLFGYQLATIYTDWLWFRELRQTGVFRTALGARLTLYFGFGLLFFIVFYANIWLAARLNRDRPRTRIFTQEREEIAEALMRGAHAIALALAVVIAFVTAGTAATHWSEYVLFTHATSFGHADPVFGRDIGFYVFRLPFLGWLQGWLLFTLAAAAIAAILFHLSQGAIDFTAPRLLIPDYLRAHALTLVGLCALVMSWGAWLGRYDLLYSDNGVFSGAGYTDLHARLPAANIQAVLAVVVALCCFVAASRAKAIKWPLYGVGAWIAAAILIGGIYPSILQTYTVTPNLLEKERPYIRNDIRFTQQAYGLEHVQVQDFPAQDSLTATQLAANQSTIENIRLWDWPELGSVYNARQALRNYYTFDLPASGVSRGDYNIDVDRYRLGDRYQQVMIGARELSPDRLPAGAQTWQNRHLQYTHGYGTVMSPVDKFGTDGLPDYYMSQIPVQANYPDLKLDRPQIYYGALAHDPVFVETRQPEVDYQLGATSQTTRYDGLGGVPLGGLSKLAWSTRLGDVNMLLSSDLTDGSRVLFRRNIHDRLMAVAPFLNWDRDFYVVVDGGRLKWIADGYTVSDKYPYSRATAVGTGVEDVDQSFNYIRNSVKAVVDAYDGTVTLYAADPNDPILATWSRAFPGLFTPMTAMPASLRAHVRYPEDLFRVQRDIYTYYHMSDPDVYYQKSDAWSVPPDPTTASDTAGGQASPMAPYYVMMRLPGQKQEEFLLMSPFTPLSQGTTGQNLAAWMSARCDPDDYGKLLVYRFPGGMNINGPQQVMALITKDPKISAYQTFLDQRGSHVIYGNLLVIPIDNALLYVVPVYVQSTGGGAVPGITQVILASGNSIVMEPTLAQAVAELGGAAPATAGGATLQAGVPPIPGAAPAPAARSSAARPAGSTADLVRQATAAYQKTRQRERAYNQSLDDLGRALQQLQSRVGAGK